MFKEREQDELKGSRQKEVLHLVQLVHPVDDPRLGSTQRIGSKSTTRVQFIHYVVDLTCRVL